MENLNIAKLFCIYTLFLILSGCYSIENINVEKRSEISEINKHLKGLVEPPRARTRDGDLVSVKNIDVNSYKFSVITSSGNLAFLPASKIELIRSSQSGKEYRLDVFNKNVGENGIPYRDEINRITRDKVSQIILINGKDYTFENLSITSDSAMGVGINGEKISFPTTFIHKIYSAYNIYNFENPEKNVSSTGKPYRSEINRYAEKYPVRVTYRNGTQTKLTDFQIGPDEISGVAPSGTSVSVATTRVKKLSILFQKGKWTYHFDEPKQQAQPARTVAAKTKKKSDEPRYTIPLDTEIPKTSMDRPHDVAVVIGIKKYDHTDVPNVDYALRDAAIMKKYLTRTLGFREKNVIFAENASSSVLERIFGTESEPQGQLYNWVKEEKSEVFIYYSGHGAPDPESGKAYLVASDTDPSYLSLNGYSVDQLYTNLAKLPATSVTVVLESCFSGVSEAGEIVQEVSPAVLNVENPMVGMENGLAITAGAADQVSSWYSEKKHGLFTYFFLKGLRGEADENGDKAVTAKELDAYLTEQVPYQAARQHNRKQTPQVVGQNKERVLVQYDNSVPATGSQER